MRRMAGILVGAVTSLIVLVLVGLTLAMTSCTPKPVQFAQARNPNCDVKPIEVRGDWARVLVTCPDEAPVERTYGR